MTLKESEHRFSTRRQNPIGFHSSCILNFGPSSVSLHDWMLTGHADNEYFGLWTILFLSNLTFKIHRHAFGTLQQYLLTFIAPKVRNFGSGLQGEANPSFLLRILRGSGMRFLSAKSNAQQSLAELFCSRQWLRAGLQTDCEGSEKTQEVAS